MPHVPHPSTPHLREWIRHPNNPATNRSSRVPLLAQPLPSEGYSPLSRKGLDMSTPVRLPDGREFPSISACARAFGVTPRCVNDHIDMGTLHNIGIGCGMAQAMPIWVDGVKWKSQRAFSNHHKLNTSQLSRIVARMRAKGIETRVWRGWNLSLKDPKECSSSAAALSQSSSPSLQSSPETTPVDAQGVLK